QVEVLGHGVAEVGVRPLRVVGDIPQLGCGCLDRLRRRAEQILVPVQRLQLGQPVLLPHVVAAGAWVIPLEAAQRRPGQPIPVRHDASSRSADSSTCVQAASASASVHSSGLWLTPPASLRTNNMPDGTPAMPVMAASCPAPEGSSTGSSPR